MYSYVFKPQAVKDLKRLPKSTQVRIFKKLDFYVSKDNPLSFADRLINFEIGSFRFRVGDYRIIFDFEDDTIIILTLGHRKEIYK